MTLRLADIAKAMRASNTEDLTATASGWSIDTRTLVAGDLYFALRGAVHDGHNHVKEAFERGAAAVVVDRDIPGDAAAGGPVLRVSDVQFALQEVARFARSRWRGEVVAVTGSAGKTTTKDAIAHFLAVRYAVGKTAGNFNNHIGVPLSILRLPDDGQIAVLELGMNHPGEIRNLAAIASPRVGVVTNVGYAHVEFFRSIDGIALAKRELIEALPSSGIAVLNADDERVARFGAVHAGKSITYGIAESASVRAENVELLPDGVRFRCQGVEFETPLSGLHGLRNVLAGIATAQIYGVAARDLVEPARTVSIGSMRGERFQRDGLTILNDAYNANPEAMRCMLDVLAVMPAGRHIAVLGEMLELGPQAEMLHRAVGARAAELKIDLLIGIRGAAREMVQGATLGGMPSSKALYFADSVEAGTALRSLVRAGDAILFKGSRSVRVERALEALFEDTL